MLIYIILVYNTLKNSYKKMIKCHMLKLGSFKSETSKGEPTKTYVYVTNVDSENTSEGVLIEQYCLTSESCRGWDIERSYKGKTLFSNHSHFLLSSFLSIVKVMHVSDEIVNKFYSKTVK